MSAEKVRSKWKGSERENSPPRCSQWDGVYVGRSLRGTEPMLGGVYAAGLLADRDVLAGLGEEQPLDLEPAPGAPTRISSVDKN